MTHENTQWKLRAENLVKIFRNRIVVNDVSFSVKTGKVVGLLGPNGAGKTNKLLYGCRAFVPRLGSVFMNDKDITDLPMHVRARNGISYLPQNMSIFRRLTVEENLVSIMEVSGVPRHERPSLLDELLVKFRIFAHFEITRSRFVWG